MRPTIIYHDSELSNVGAIHVIVEGKYMGAGGEQRALEHGHVSSNRRSRAFYIQEVACGARYRIKKL